MGVDAVYYDSERISGADPATFRLVQNLPPPTPNADYEIRISYALDGRSVYYRGKKIEGADPGTFRIYPSKYYEEYAYDKSSVYFNGGRIEGADPQTFTVLKQQPYEGCSNGAFGKDSRAVYYETDVVSGADPKTFTPLIDGYGKDDQHSFYTNIMLPIAPKELEVVCHYG